MSVAAGVTVGRRTSGFRDDTGIGIGIGSDGGGGGSSGDRNGPNYSSSDNSSRSSGRPTGEGPSLGGYSEGTGPDGTLDAIPFNRGKVPREIRILGSEEKKRVTGGNTKEPDVQQRQATRHLLGFWARRRHIVCVLICSSLSSA